MCSLVNKSKNKRRGQSVVEFVFVIIIFLNLLVITFNAVMAFAVQQYISYATFMAARTYQASQENPTAQRDLANRTLESYLYFSKSTPGIFNFPGYNKVLARDVEIILPPDGPSRPPYGQVQPMEAAKFEVRFKVPLFQLPFPGIDKELVWVPLKATSYLGREPARSECRDFFQGFYNYYKRGGRDYWEAMFDDNC